MSLGTSGTIFSYSQTPVIDPQGNIAAFCSSTGGWLPLICTMNCTTAMERMRELFDTDLASLERNLSAADRGAGGIVTVPFFTGRAHTRPTQRESLHVWLGRSEYAARELPTLCNRRALPLDSELA
jgi:xylulokinase